MKEKNITPCQVNVSSETGRLRAVLLHRPGVEIERMTPLNAAHCLYSDILNKVSVDQEYRNFCGVLERWTNVYYVEDILEELLRRDDIKTDLVRESVFHPRRFYRHLRAFSAGRPEVREMLSEACASARSEEERALFAALLREEDAI